MTYNFFFSCKLLSKFFNNSLLWVKMGCLYSVDVTIIEKKEKNKLP